MKQFDPPLTLIENPEISLSDDGRTFTLLSVSFFSDSIFIHPIPKQCFDKVEENIEEAIEHEHLHLVLQQSLHLFKASHMLDNIVPSVGDLKKLIDKLESKKTLSLNISLS